MVEASVVTIRPARLDEVPALSGLIAASLRKLGAEDYSPETVEGALQGACAVDTQLIRDGTYFVVEWGADLAGCGGWSFRQTLFGGDARPGRDPLCLDPAVDAAKIRAFFVAPAYARKGIGSLLLRHCEAEAALKGFRRFELMSTLPGVRLYSRFGYEADPSIQYDIPGGNTIEFVPMRKSQIQPGTPDQ